jgi:hypothetical protein
MTRDDINRMAEAAEFPARRAFSDLSDLYPRLERFAALVAAAEREKVARWMMERGYATGHGDSTEELLQELDWQIAENWNRALINGITTEREACAKVCEDQDTGQSLPHDVAVIECAAAIRARGEAK